MRIAVLTHAEAADSAVFANLARHLLGDSGAISYVDRPDVGAIPLALAAQPVATPSPAALVFGGASAPAVPPVPSLPSAATAPTAAPVPPTPPAPPAPGSAGPQVDSRGLPWDGRIHASTKAFLKDGTWRQKRDTDPALVTQVEAELRQVMGLPAPATAAVPPAPVVNSVFAAGAAAAGLPPPVLVPPAPAPVAAVPPAPPAANPAPAGDPATFADLMLWLTPHMPHKLTPEQLNGTLSANGLPGLPGLMHRPDLVPVIVAQIKPMLGLA